MSKGPSPTRKNRSVFSSPRPEKGLERLQKLQGNLFVQLTLFLAFVLSAVAVMTAGFNVREIALDATQIGTPTLRAVTASRDFTYVEKDAARTEARRDSVARSVPSVYDWREGLGETLRDDIRRAFSSMRTSIAARLREEALLNKPSPAPPGDESAPAVAMSDTEVIATADPERVITLARELRQEHFTPHFPAPLNDPDFERFARHGFSPRLENALSMLVHDIMGNLIVPSSRVIEEERERGIYLRRMRDDKVLIEYHVTDLRGRLTGREAIPGMLRELVQQRDLLSDSPRLRATVVNVINHAARPNTTYNEAMTLEKREAARRAVEDVVLREDFRKGQVIVDEGQLVTARHVRIYQRMVEEDELWNATQLIAGLILFTLILFVTFYLFGHHNISEFKLTPRDIGFMGVTMLLFLLTARLGKAMSYAIAEQMTSVPAEAWLFLIPVAGAGMLVRLILRSEHTIIFSIVYALLVGLIMDELLFYSSFTLIGCLVGAGFVRQINHRLGLIWSGLLIGGVNALVMMGYLLTQGELFQAETLGMLTLAFTGGIASGFFVHTILPVFEWSFGYTTDIKLLELANLNNPLMRELILRAPGSYHHSMMVGSLCEAAAEEIGCNSLLARVGAYYHDIGKARNPGYFAENQKYGENPHDKLKPNMSALIIKAHVKDGVEMARQHRLPREIIAFIEQHHGTSLISYFYHKAKQLEDPDIPEVDEKDYRYPGPKPQTRETAICLLADGIEAASRAMPNKSPARLKGLVQTMINRAFTDGQLDECDLTLKDLNLIAAAFTRILTGIYHHRPEYPDQKKGKDSGKAKDSGVKPSSQSQRDGDDARRASKGRASRARGAGASSGERKTPATQDDRSNGQAANSSDARGHDDDHRGPDEGSGDDAPNASSADGGPPEEGRAPLPRLGSP